MTQLRVRFAPSPTGHLHLGGLRSAYYNWLLARQKNGVFLLRIEDTDVVRSKKEYVDSILSSFDWIGVKADEPLVFQMERQDVHLKAAQSLMESGKAYPCFCAPVDADERMENLDAGVGSKYDKTCRNKPYTTEDLKKPYAIRFKIPDNQGPVSFTDLVRGNIVFDPDQFDDFIIVRRDGTPIYNFCVVVDDIDMRVTLVLRGEDHISNTPKQILYYEALGAKIPDFAHIPLILGPEGNRLSKRDGAVSVTEYKEQGYLPDALLNYLVRLGWSSGDQEIFTREELIKLFSLEAVGKKGSIFDVKKLEWVNATYIKALSFEHFKHAIKALKIDYAKEFAAVWTEAQVEQLFELYKDRSVRLKDMCDDMLRLATRPHNYDYALIAPFRVDATRDLLNAYTQFLNEHKGSLVTHDVLNAKAKELCAQFGVKFPALAQPIRCALTGTIQAPGVFNLIEILGAEESYTRLKAFIAGL